MKADIDQIRNAVIPILKEAGVSRSSIFGSYVRGEATKDSDIDMLVELPKGKSLFDFIELQHRLEDALHKRVDLGEYTTVKPRLKDLILKEAVQIL